MLCAQLRHLLSFKIPASEIIFQVMYAPDNKWMIPAICMHAGFDQVEVWSGEDARGRETPNVLTMLPMCDCHGNEPPSGTLNVLGTRATTFHFPMGNLSCIQKMREKSRLRQLLDYCVGTKLAVVVDQPSVKRQEVTLEIASTAVPSFGSGFGGNWIGHIASGRQAGPSAAQKRKDPSA